MNTALIIVDVQYDFLPAFKYQPDWNGALAVPDGDKILEPLFNLLNIDDGYYKFVVASYDWHPKNHMSFAENGGQWPAHCVQNTMGAEIEQSIADLSDFYVEKGGNPDIEAYSAFDGFVHEDNSPPLAEFLKAKEIERVEICGLALDYCVRATAVDAVLNGFKTEVLLDLTRPVTWKTGMQAISVMQDVGITLGYT